MSRKIASKELSIPGQSNLQHYYSRQICLLLEVLFLCNMHDTRYKNDR